MIRQELERDRLAQLEIVGPIDFTHAAFAQQADDTVTTREYHSRYKSGVVD
jgi:hypothetical protein